jgi:hypothetical protein
MKTSSIELKFQVWDNKWRHLFRARLISASKARRAKKTLDSLFPRQVGMSHMLNKWRRAVEILSLFSFL